jgi:hypothetical protein
MLKLLLFAIGTVAWPQAEFFDLKGKVNSLRQKHIRAIISLRL